SGKRAVPRSLSKRPVQKPGARAPAEAGRFPAPLSDSSDALATDTARASQTIALAQIMRRAQPFQGTDGVGPIRLRPLPVSGAGAFTPSCIEVNSPIGDRDAESRSNSTRHQPDFAAMCANQLCRYGKAQAGSARTRGALKCLKQMRASLFRDTRSCVGN